ncbi:SOS response-associated peptidase [Demequina sp. SYSU T00192]|uniref:Abasic site processing protein n=1 Tax=Demequina litoralis TaxID=3051660 RepID=A0ABT8GBT8_9MICO|nr:SOS response-associated peptidase [Demequina sp. SYSU T00192]MDN4476611.1 SOS response-associated peptidase [Demequina sp. SYSU T00192]
MCGRYANFLTEQELVDAFEIAVIADDARLAPRYNIGPMQDTSIVVARKEEGRSLELAKWGLVPSWAKDPAIGSRMFNARSETVAEKPSFRSAFAKRRCLVPASGYFEWTTVDGVKTPYFIHTEDGSPLAFAGLFEFWRDKALGDDAPWLATCSIVTAASRGDMQEIHDRQPVMLLGDEADAWLDHDSSKDDLFAAIASPAPALVWHEVDRAVGNIRNQGEELVAPV